MNVWCFNRYTHYKPNYWVRGIDWGTRFYPRTINIHGFYSQNIWVIVCWLGEIWCPFDLLANCIEIYWLVHYGADMKTIGFWFQHLYCVPLAQVLAFGSNTQVQYPFKIPALIQYNFSRKTTLKGKKCDLDHQVLTQHPVHRWSVIV